jgi:arsenate reductase
MRYLDWNITDPAGQPIEAVREIRDEISNRVETLLAELLQRESAIHTPTVDF